MEPNTTPGASPETNANITPAATDNQAQPTSKKSLNIFLVFLTLISLAAAITFAVLFFMNQPKSAPDNQANPSGQNSPTPETEPDTEVELTDTYIIRDLDEKISLLLHNSDTEASFNSGPNIVMYDVDLFKNGSFDQSTGAWLIISSNISTIQDHDKIESVISDNNYNDADIDYLRRNGISGVSGEEVREKYQNVSAKNSLWVLKPRDIVVINITPNMIFIIKTYSVAAAQLPSLDIFIKTIILPTRITPTFMYRQLF